jgi:hypothetical protein
MHSREASPFMSSFFPIQFFHLSLTHVLAHGRSCDHALLLPVRYGSHHEEWQHLLSRQLEPAPRGQQARPLHPEGHAPSRSWPARCTSGSTSRHALSVASSPALPTPPAPVAVIVQAIIHVYAEDLPTLHCLASAATWASSTIETTMMKCLRGKRQCIFTSSLS